MNFTDGLLHTSWSAARLAALTGYLFKAGGSAFLFDLGRRTGSLNGPPLQKPSERAGVGQ